MTNLNFIDPISSANIRQAVADAIRILKHNLQDFTHAFPQSNSQNNIYSPMDNIEWTTGFCTGEYWLAYELSQVEDFRKAASIQVDSFYHRILQHIDVDHHDMGFLYSPSCVAAYRLTQNQTAFKAALLAADNLIRRFQPKGNFLQAWGELGAKNNYRLIIDCLLNLPLLYWASEVTGEKHYQEIADLHTETALKYLVREDFSTYHTYFFDPLTGLPEYGMTAQGYRDSSAWARGQAWGIYGLALSYRYTKNPKALELFHKVTEFYLAKLPEDLIPFWDLDFTSAHKEPKDSSAGAIAACGILEMAKFLPTDAANQYTDIAKRIAASLAANYRVKDISISNGLLLHGVYAKKSPYNTVTDRGVDECNTWGDYFWLELLTRLSKDWTIYW